MIPADEITIDGDTAWLVEWPAPDSPSGWPVNRNDRPCDTCDGDGGTFRPDGSIIGACIDCHGTGRHVFEIEVDTNVDWRGVEDGPPNPPDVFRVYVVEVLPIQDRAFTSGPRQIVPSDTPGKWWIWDDTQTGETITLPPAAEPGMWAVRLKVLS